MTSAINGRIIYKQAPRTWLDQNIRPNSLVFDLTNNILLYSPSGTTYYEFYPGITSGGSVSAIQWNNILNKPVASISTSGVLTNADWILFNGKADSSAIPVMSNYYPVSSTGNISGLTSPAQTQINTLSATVSELVATSGSGGVSAVTWSIVQNIPVASVSTSGVLTSSDYNKFNNKADVSAIPITSGYALNSSLNNYYPVSSTGNISGLTSPAQTQINNISANYATINEVSVISAGFKNSLSAYLPLSGGVMSGNLSASNISANRLYGNISGTNFSNIIYQTLTLVDTLSSTASATISDLKQFNPIITPNVLNLVVSGGSSGTYTANYNIYTTIDDINLLKIAYGTLTSANNIDSNSIINLFMYNKFAADISISGTPSSKLTVFVKS